MIISLSPLAAHMSSAVTGHVQAVKQVTTLEPQESTPFVGEALTRLREEVIAGLSSTLLIVLNLVSS